MTERGAAGAPLGTNARGCQWGLLVLVAALAGSACSSAPSNSCNPICDRASAFTVVVDDAQPAAISVTGPCSSTDACVAAGSCSSALFVVGGPGSCHLEVASLHGDVFERDLPIADLTKDPCCPGYDIGFQNTRIVVSFPVSDAGTD